MRSTPCCSLSQLVDGLFTWQLKGYRIGILAPFGFGETAAVESPVFAPMGGSANLITNIQADQLEIS